jgi:hypothetical protein
MEVAIDLHLYEGETVKTKIIAALTISCLIFMSGQGQNSGNDAKRKILAWRVNVLGASREPYRKVNGKIYDLSPFFAYSMRVVDDPDFAQSAPPPPSEWGNWQMLFGTVLQIVNKECILLKKYDDPEFEGDSHIVCLKNFPREKDLVDGNKLAAFVCFDGRYSYLNTGGARSTVESYDYGQVVIGEELDKFKSKGEAEATARRDELEKLRARQENTQKEKRKETSRKVFEYYSQKATNGEGLAQMRFGEIYLRGEGVETNTDLARKWLSAAITNGYPQATNLLLEIESGSVGSK